MLRGKILFLSLLAVGVITALLFLAQMWTDFLDWDVFGKIMITLAVAGVLVSFLAAVDYDMPGSRSKFMLLAAVALGIALAGLIIEQLWWGAIEAGTFGKLIISDLVLLGLISFILAVSEDFGANSRLRKDKYID